MSSLTLRLIRSTVVVAAFASTSPTPTLRAAAHRAAVLVGTGVRPSQLAELAHATSLAREFNTTEPEDVMKWWVVRANVDTFQFPQADDVVRLASAQGMKVR